MNRSRAVIESWNGTAMRHTATGFAAVYNVNKTGGVRQAHFVRKGDKLADREGVDIEVTSAKVIAHARFPCSGAELPRALACL